MKVKTFHEILRQLEQAREDLSQDAQNRAAEGVDQAIASLRRAYEAGEIGHLSNTEVLKLISEIVTRLGPLATLIDTILKRLL